MARGLEDYPPHKILDKPWTYRVTGVNFVCASDNFSQWSLDLSLRQGAKTVILRFTGVHELEIEEGFPSITSGLEILDAASSGMEHARVRVRNSEQGGNIRFWAAEVSLVAAAP